MLLPSNQALNKHFSSTEGFSEVIEPQMNEYFKPEKVMHERYSGIDAPVLQGLYDEGIKNVNKGEVTMKMGADIYSNLVEDAPPTNPDTLQSASQIALQGIEIIKGKLDAKKQNVYLQQLKAHCGKKPFIGKKKRHTYFECQAKFNKDYAKKEKISGVPDSSKISPNKSSGGEWYKNPAVIVGGLGLLGIVGFFAFRKKTTLVPIKIKTI